ncbi:unnamed protein product [Enterobius vermicularis]|uniref:7TM_GPCR_Srx domain-containing protein n=1 Tax=Enterobius vermicularis TaxID=51028 RepID=A0A0N4VQ35_ENTVE|nr:unnamed protein product [Enterobius vermicularis]
MEETTVIKYQIIILIFMIVFCDTIALCIVLTMAIGKRSYITAQLPSVLISEKKFEHTFGPFWIYLTAISFHMIAAGMMCIIGISRRYIITDLLFEAYI